MKETEQTPELTTERHDAPVLSPESLAAMAPEIQGLSAEMEVARKELVMLGRPEGFTTQEEETDRILNLVARINEMRQKANILIEEANAFMPDDRLESGKAVYGKMPLFGIRTELTAQAREEWESVKSEKKAARIKNEVRHDAIKELEVASSQDGARLNVLLETLLGSAEKMGAQASGLAGIWNMARGKTKGLLDQRTKCLDVAHSLKVFLEESTEQEKFSVKYVSRLDDIAAVFKNETYRHALQAAGVNIEEITALLQKIKEEDERKDKISGKNYGIDKSKVLSVESKLITLTSAYRSEGGGPAEIDKTVEKWTEINKIQEALGVDQKNEKTRLETLKQAGVPETVRASNERSFRNIRESIFFYAQSRIKTGATAEMVIDELRQEAENIKETMTLSYNERAEDIVKIIESGKILNLFEHNDDEKAKRKKSMSDAETIMALRKIIDKKLGWEDTRVYHLAVDDADNDKTNGSANEYGSVRLQFKYDNFSDKATFTESDSLNPRGLPPALSDKRDISSASRGVADRQISSDHVPFAKAIFNLLEKQNPTRDGREMRYIEAQIGGMTGNDLIDNLTGIAVDSEEFKKEAEFAGVNEAEIIEKIKKFCEQKSIKFTLTASIA